MTEQRLAGRVAIVTGASRGIGEAIAVAFAREGAAVAVAARTEAVFDPRLPGTIHETVAKITDGGRARRRDPGRSRPRRRRRPPRRRGTCGARPHRPARQQRGGDGSRPSPPQGGAPATPAAEPAPAAASAATRATATTASERGAARPGAGSFLEFPLKGYRLHFQVGTLRLLSADAASAARHDLARAGRDRQHQLARRLHPRRGTVRTPRPAEWVRLRRQQGGDAPPHRGGGVRDGGRTASP